MNFKSVIDQILKVEKGYVDHPNDRGGPTNFGITQATARANGYTGDMRDLPESLARTIYENRYIVEPRFNEVAQLSELVGGELVDTGVNMGPARAAEFFQRLLNVFNAQGSRYDDLFVDGRIGKITLDAFKKYIQWRGGEGEIVMFKALNSLQGARYVELAENNKSQESFVYGWFKNRIE